jgi:transposase
MKKGQVCWVVAPSLLPQKPGDRGKTNRRDAITLARLMRSGDFPPVSGPQVEEAAMRDLCRARAAALRDRKAATFRLTAFLLRQAIRSIGRATWGPAHLRWLSAVGWPTPAQPSVFQANVRAVTEPTARLARLEPERTDQGQTWRLVPGVEALQALRGRQCTVAVTTVADLGDLTRFEHPRQLLSYLGLTSSAYAAGVRRRQGGITKAGNTHARRALIEDAWAARYPRQRPSASPTAPGEGAQAHPGHELASPGTTLQTLSATERPREKRQPGGWRHRPGTACVYVGHGSGGPTHSIDRDR